MVFLDNARTTQALELSAKQKAKLKRHLAQYGFANVAAENLRLCRKKIAKLLSCDEDEIFFFPQGCTAAINYVAITLAQNLTSLEKSQIITTQAEHHANYLPWLAYFQEVQILPLDQKSKKIIWPTTAELTKTRLLAISAKSNVLGRLWQKDFLDLANLVTAAKEQGCLVLLDGAQVIAFEPQFNLGKIKADFLAFSAHKVYGPLNLGILFIRKAAQAYLPPPAQTEQTLPIAELFAFGHTLKSLLRTNLYRKQRQEEALAREVILFLQQFPFVQLINDHQVSNIVTFSLLGLHVHDVADILAQEGVIVRAGDHCAKPLHDALGARQSIRISFSCYNDRKDIRGFKKAFVKACTFLRS